MHQREHEFAVLAMAGRRRFLRGVDPLTHVLLGGSLAYAAFARKIGRTAAVAGGLAAFAPDADVFIRSATDPLLAIEHHRGFTHALAFAPAGAALVAALWLFRAGWRERRRWVWLWLAALIAYVSHMLLDAATSYGTQLLWPFSRQRAGWDLISIIDPPLTLALLAGLVLAWRRQRPGAALAGLAVAAAYLTLGGVQHGRAIEAQRRLAASRGHAIERLEVRPTLANDIIWRALYTYQGKIYADRVRVGWFSPPSVREGWSLPLVQGADLTPEERARNRRGSFERFAWFSDQWVGRSPHDATVLSDMRYSLSSAAFDPIWGIRFTPPGAPAEVEWVNRTRSRQLGLGDLWRELRGVDPRYRPLDGLDVATTAGGR